MQKKCQLVTKSVQYARRLAKLLRILEYDHVLASHVILILYVNPKMEHFILSIFLK